MKADRVLQEISEVIEPILQSQGYELVDLEYQRERQGWVLRIFLDREGGVTLDDCTEVSHEVGAALEVRDVIPHSYVLEVSSPGLTRPLKKPADYHRFRGRPVKIKLHQPLEDRKNFKGRLLGLEGETIRVEAEGKVFAIPLKSVAKANLEIDF